MSGSEADGRIRKFTIPEKVCGSSVYGSGGEWVCGCVRGVDGEAMSAWFSHMCSHQPHTHTPCDMALQKEWVPLLKATEIAPGDLIPVSK